MTEEETEDMRKQNNDQGKDIAVMKVQVDAIFKKQDEIMELMKDEFSMMRGSYTKAINKLEIDNATFRNEQRIICDEHKKFLDDHCIRLRVIEKEKAVFETELRPIKKIYDNLATFLIGFIIVIGSIFVGAIYYIREKL